MSEQDHTELERFRRLGPFGKFQWISELLFAWVCRRGCMATGGL